jgi:uncharacterized phage protein (TIGR01671 family)
MREIKFRVWDKTKNRWDQPSLLEVFSDDGILGHLYDSKKEYTVIQQYTGLKDKNDKDIYEGDYIKYAKPSDEDCLKRNSSNIVLVRQTEPHEDNHPGFRIVDLWGQYGEIEIIGNIFENPELLK